MLLQNTNNNYVIELDLCCGRSKSLHKKLLKLRVSEIHVQQGVAVILKFNFNNKIIMLLQKEINPIMPLNFSGLCCGRSKSLHQKLLV